MMNDTLKKRILRCLFLPVLLLGSESICLSQQISIDRGIRLEGLWCFPTVSDSLEYLYLPDHAYLSLNEKKRPEFSFLRYVNNSEQTDFTSANSISSGGGGGILHFLVIYDTDEKKIKKAEEAIKQLLNNPDAKLKGPVIFKQGRYALVSTVLKNGKDEKQVMAMGDAPVLQGSKIALAFELDPVHSKILLESFKMPTPDISLVFDLVFSGLSDAYSANLTVDWTEVQKNEKIGGGLNVYFVSAEVEKIYEELRQSSAIKLETRGEDSKMEAIVNNAYSKVTEMMFRSVEPEQLSGNDQGGLSGILGSFLSNQNNGALSSGKLFNFGAHFGYKLKNIKTSGYSIMNFNSRTTRDLHHYITFNIGDLYKKYGTDQNYFKTVSLSDPDFEQRDIVVGIDGALLPEFEKMINSITVTMRKTHQNGNETLKEVNITKSAIADPTPVRMRYGSALDVDRMKWLEYEYKAQYYFKGGKTFQTGWQKQTAAMINLYVPYERRTIHIEGDPELLKNKGVRATTIRIEYPFFGENKIIELTAKPDDDLNQKQADITLPAGQYNYKYTIKRIMKDGTETIRVGENDTGLIFIDIF